MEVAEKRVLFRPEPEKNPSTDYHLGNAIHYKLKLKALTI
jgi:hypothetical protein